MRFVHLTVELLEPLRMNQLGVDDRRPRYGAQRRGKMREPIGPVGAVARVERDSVPRFVHDHPVAVELHLVPPAFAFGQPVSQGRFAGRDEGGGMRHMPNVGVESTSSN